MRPNYQHLFNQEDPEPSILRDLDELRELAENFSDDDEFNPQHLYDVFIRALSIFMELDTELFIDETTIINAIRSNMLKNYQAYNLNYEHVLFANINNWLKANPSNYDFHCKEKHWAHVKKCTLKVLREAYATYSLRGINYELFEAEMERLLAQESSRNASELSQSIENTEAYTLYKKIKSYAEDLYQTKEATDNIRQYSFGITSDNVELTDNFFAFRCFIDGVDVAKIYHHQNAHKMKQQLCDRDCLKPPCLQRTITAFRDRFLNPDNYHNTNEKTILCHKLFKYYLTNENSDIEQRNISTDGAYFFGDYDSGIYTFKYVYDKMGCQTQGTVSKSGNIANEVRIRELQEQENNAHMDNVLNENEYRNTYRW